MTSFLVAAIHLLSLVLGVTALVRRAAAIEVVRTTRDEAQLGRVFFWDNVYGGVAVVWLGSGVYRAFGGLEKGAAYYLGNHVFWLKMLALVALLGAEAFIAVRLVRYRIEKSKKQPLDWKPLDGLSRLHRVEWALILVMVVSAVFMARGVGTVPKKKSLEAAPAAVSAEELRLGAKIYRNHCASCHQADGRGFGGKVAANFIDDPTRLAKSDEALLESIAHGVPNTAMIGFEGRLEINERRAVLGYVRESFGKK